MNMYLYMYVTNTYDQVYVYVIINESLYILAHHKDTSPMSDLQHLSNFFLTKAMHFYSLNQISIHL